MNGIHSSALTANTDNLARYMDLLSTRQKLVASNLANADTPGFHTKDIDFQFEYMSLLRGQQPVTMEPEGLYEKPDGNNVNVDREARLLAENTIRFNLASSLVRGNLESIRKAIHEGKG
jgi:flagellar basal-body rod protein FlgB